MTSFQFIAHVTLRASKRFSNKWTDASGQGALLVNNMPFPASF